MRLTDDELTTLLAGERPAPTPAFAPSLDALGPRKLVQASSIELGAPADRIDDVGQEVLRVVGTYDGIVDRSIVTSGDGGGAHFELRLPSDRLQPALGALSRLDHAHV